MKLVITESQLKRLVSEQMAGLGPAGGYDYQKPEVVKAAGQIAYDTVVNMDPHTRNGILEFGAAFIPYVGPYVSMGIAAYDASLYYKEGKKKEAGLALVLGMLPGITAVASKVPGVRQLGVKGMNMLAEKIATGVTKFTPIELDIIKGINLNKALIHQETDGLLRRTMNNVINKAGSKAVNPALNKAVNTAGKYGVEKTVANQALQKGVATTYNAAYDAARR